MGMVRPLRALARPARAATIPILMYHSISDDLDERRGPYYRTVTSPARFRRHMETLRRRGYRALTLADAARELAGPQRADAAPAVAVTFDDGYDDFRTAAFPVMRDLGIAATVFVSTGFLGKPFLDGRPCLGAADVEALAAQGVEFGSHTVTHPQLHDVPATRRREELSRSRETIAALVGGSVPSFCYPFRFPSEDPAFTASLVEELSVCGYHQGVTTTIGVARPGDPGYLLCRVPVNDCDDDAFFEAKLDGHYDWLRLPQSARKQLRAIFGI